MATHLDRGAVVAALTVEFAALDELAAGLTDAEWKLPTALPGWDVQANVAHILGTEAMLLGEANPAVDGDMRALPHVRNDIGAFNEAWVATMAPKAPAAVLAALRDRVGKRLAALGELDDQAWSKEGFTPAGQDTYGRFMRIRVFDIWLHEQDIRDAVGRPGHRSGPVVDLVLDEMAASMGFVVGKLAGAPDGSSVTFALTGPNGRDVHVLVDGRAAVVPSLPGPATTTLRLPVASFVRLAGGRSADTSAVQVEGDADLAARLLANLAYTI